MMSHDAFLELAAAAIDFELTVAERSHLDEHVAACAACRRSADALRADARAMAALTPMRLSERRADVLLASVLRPGVSRSGSLRLLAVAALLAVLAIGSLLVGSELLRRTSQDDLSVVPPAPSGTVAPQSSPSLPSATPAATPSALAIDPAMIGRQWERVTIPGAMGTEPGGVYPDGVIAGGPGAIAWGEAYAQAPRIWLSADGTSWELAQVELPPDPDTENQGTILDIAPGGPGYVAVGFFLERGGSHRALVWTSPDGRTWSLVPDDPVLDQAIIDSVVSGGVEGADGELFAFGHWSAGPSGGATSPKMWSSTDGIQWDEDALTLPAGLTMTYTASVGGSLWAIGRPEGADLAGSEIESVLTSFDGRTWTTSSLPRQWGWLHPALGGLVALVIPQTGAPDPSFAGTPPPDPGIYRTTDMRTWDLVSDDTSAIGSDLVEVGDVIVMVGNDLATGPDCSTDCRPMAWRSADDGGTWEAVTADGDGGRMLHVAALPDGTLVALGILIDGEGDPSAAAWVSKPTAAPGASLGASPAPPAGALPLPPAAVVATTDGPGEPGTMFTVHLAWSPGVATDVYRIYLYDTGIGPGSSVCVLDRARASVLLETKPGATSADVSLDSAVTDSGVRCLYIVAENAAGESSPALAWRSD